MPSICKNAECTKESTYGYTKVEFCKLHKADDMLFLRYTKCKEDGCIQRPTHNLPNTNRRLYCQVHASIDMVHIVLTVQCKYEDCNKAANYGDPGKTGQYCYHHKQDNMIDVKHQLCKSNDCNKRATFNLIEEQKPIYIVMIIRRSIWLILEASNVRT